MALLCIRMLESQNLRAHGARGRVTPTSIYVHRSAVVYALYTPLCAFGKSLGAYSALSPFAGSFGEAIRDLC